MEYIQKAAVLSSGGVDSTTCIALAVKNMGKDNVLSISVNYGQRHDKELECAEKIAEYYHIKHIVIDLRNIFTFSDCALLKNSNKTIAAGSYSEQIKNNNNAPVNTYVPFRNGVMISAAASAAASLYPDKYINIYVGAHSDDSAGLAYPDCSEEFISYIDKAIETGTYGKARVTAPFVNKNKAAVIKCGLELEVPYYLTWSCYEGGQIACGKCGTCIDRKKAFKENGIEDPIKYRD